MAILSINNTLATHSVFLVLKTRNIYTHFNDKIVYMH